MEFRERCIGDADNDGFDHRMSINGDRRIKENQ